MDFEVLILFLMFAIFTSFFTVDFVFAQTTNPTLNVLTMTLNPGGNVFLIGSGFEPSSTFVIKLDGTRLGTVGTTSKGTFSQSLIIPSFVSVDDHILTIERGKILQSVKVSVTTSQKIPQYMQEKIDAEKSSTRSGGITQQGVGNIPGSQSAESDKITICHVPPGNPDNVHTITISKSALETHLAHGDYVGECKEDSKKKAPVAGNVPKKSERETAETEDKNLNDKIKNEDKDDEDSANKDSDIENEAVGDSNEQESASKNAEKEIKSSTSSSSSSEKSGTKKIPSTDIVPTSGKPRTKVLISGIDFPPNASVTLVSNSLGIRAVSLKTSSVGSFSTTITIPSNTPSDTYPIEIISDANRGTEYFTVIGSDTKSETTTGNAKSGTQKGLSVTLFPDSGPPGTKATISGSNFPANVDVSLMFTSLAIRTVNLKTDSSGSFSTTITIPTSTLAGAYPIEVLTEAHVNPLYFTVIAADLKSDAGSVKAFGTPKTASLKVLPESGPPGAILTFTGFGFTPEKTYSLYFANDKAFVSFVTDKEGNFKKIIDNAPLFSTHTTLQFYAKDDETKSILASTTWTQVSPTISISKSGSSKDATFTLSGSGFISTKSVDLVFDGVTGDSVTTNSNGILSSYKIPSYYLTSGDHTVQIIQNGIVVSSAIFTVPQGLETPQEISPFSRGKILAVTPTSGPPGTKLIFEGEGFSPTKSYRLFSYPNTVHQSPIIKPASDGTFSASSNGIVLGVSSTTQFHIVESGTKSILASATWTQTEPLISVSPSSGSKDADFTLEGSGFAASKSVDVMVDGLYYTTTSTSLTGILSVSQLPIYATTPTHTVQVIQNKVVVASTTFDAG